MSSDCHTNGTMARAAHEPHLIAQQAAAHASHAAHAAFAQHRHLLRRRQVLVLGLMRLLPLPERLRGKRATSQAGGHKQAAEVRRYGSRQCTRHIVTATCACEERQINAAKTVMQVWVFNAGAALETHQDGGTDSITTTVAARKPQDARLAQHAMRQEVQGMRIQPADGTPERSKPEPDNNPNAYPTP